MLSTLRQHLEGNRVSAIADWAVLVLGAVMLTTAIVGTLLTPASDMQTHALTQAAHDRAAL
ncbi:hypothetical protein [Shimia ponticola]|uniref:hypothetical protein n=1 Tax=Shimia ponticola TaxID=2582893 RepID=UPI0011BF04B2|nr:hypothetical protein [Shimia ponticola]